MKQALLISIVSVVSFATGLTFNSPGRASKSRDNSQSISSSSAVASPTPCPEEEFPKLINDRHVTKFNGQRLNLEYASGVQAADIPFALNEAQVTVIGDGGLLVSLGDTLYRLNRQREVIWRYQTAQLMFGFAYVESTNLVYGTAGDNVMFVLDASNGKVLTSDSRNGSAAYGVAAKYGDDMCLVTDNFVMYREKSRGDEMEPMKDGITCWRGTRILWHRDFPPDADLVVNGKRILAVTKSKTAIYVQEITPPQTKSE